MRPSRPSRRAGEQDQPAGALELAVDRVQHGGEAAQHVADREQRRQQVDPSPKRVPPGAPLARAGGGSSGPSCTSPGGEARDDGDAGSRALTGAHHRPQRAAGRKRSTREPNLIRPTRSPRETVCPAERSHTTRRASEPAICLYATVPSAPSMTHEAVLVELRGLVAERGELGARGAARLAHGAGDRRAIHVDVGRGHEDRDLLRQPDPGHRGGGRHRRREPCRRPGRAPPLAARPRPGRGHGRRRRTRASPTQHDHRYGRGAESPGNDPGQGRDQHERVAFGGERQHRASGRGCAGALPSGP